MKPPASNLARLVATGLLLLCASCATVERRPAPPPPRADAALEASCRSIETAHDWQRSAPPGQPARGLFTVPAGATAQLWFQGRNRALALCTPCAQGSAAVRSFEWYEAGFRKGELKLLNCPR